MDSLEGRTAVVTGAASGIGFAIAARLADAGANVVLADVEVAALGAATDSLRARGANAVAVPTDVADAAAVDALASQTRNVFGNVHVLCNNAGVGVTEPIASLTIEDWTWVIGVNLWGVVHGLRSFVPGMLEHGEGGHIVNTASMAGLIPGAPGIAPYSATKHAVVALSESLHHELHAAGDQVGVSLLCPGLVDTRIHRAERNRPGQSVDVTGDDTTIGTLLGGSFPGGVLAPTAVADQVYAAILNRRFYVLTHPDWTDLVSLRHEIIVNGRDPELAMPGMVRR